MSHKQVIDLEQLRHATEQIRDEKYAAVRILGNATLNLYEKLEKIHTNSVIKQDTIELFHRIDKLVALFRDSPWKDMKGNEWKNILFAEISTLEPFIKAFPKQIQKTKLSDEYVLKALQSYCDEVMVARKEVDNLSWILKKVVNVYLGPIFTPFDQIAQTLQTKATEFDIDLAWKEPPAPPVAPVIEEPVIEEKFEVTIEAIKLETDILKKLKAIENTLQAESDSFESIQTEAEEQVNNKSLLKKLIRANSIVSLKEVGGAIHVSEEQASAVENKTELMPILAVIETYLAAEEDDSLKNPNVEQLQQLSFDELAVLFERIQSTTIHIAKKISSLEKPKARLLEKPVEPTPPVININEPIQSTPGWFSGISEEQIKALMNANQQLRDEKYELQQQDYQSKLKLFELETQHDVYQQELYDEKLLILQKDLSLLNLAKNIIAGILENAADQKIIGLERLMLRLKELKTVPIVEQLEEQRLLPPPELTRSEKINLFYKKLIKRVINPLIIIWEILIYLNQKFNPPATDSAKLDDPAFYAQNENSESQESSHKKVVTKLSASKRAEAEEDEVKKEESKGKGTEYDGSEDSEAKQGSHRATPIDTDEEEAESSLSA